MIVSWIVKAVRWLLWMDLWRPQSDETKPTSCSHTPEPTVSCPECKQQNWIVSAFNLTFAAFIPFWGSMCDIFGRHTTLQANMAIIMVGSAICTGSPTSAFPLLLFGRALQGIACAGLDVVTRVILADRVSLRESNANWTMFSYIDGISFGVGPVIGGYMTETDWRWCFGINLPLAAAGIVVVLLRLRKELLGPQPLPRIDSTVDTSRRRTRLLHRLRTIDWWGQLLFLFGLGLVVLALTWGGAVYPWASAAVLVPLCAGAILIAGWVCWEYLMSEDGALGAKWPWKAPMMQWRIISDRNIALSAYASFVNGAAMFAVFYFCSIYYVLVAGKDPSDAGIGLLLFTPGVGGGLLAALYLVNVWPRNTYTPLLLGAVLQSVSMGMLAWALYVERSPVIMGMMALVGVGSGFRLLCLTIHAIGMFPDHVATVVSLVAVANPLGGTLGHTMMSTVFNNVVNLGSTDDLTSDLESFRDLPAGVLSDITHRVKMGVVWAYVSLVPLMVIGIAAALFLGTVILPEGKGSEEDRRANIVIREPYFWILLRGRKYRGLGDQSESNELFEGANGTDDNANGERGARLEMT
ncbi:hypothetical protein VUR80DRAFT_8363 [Thermomyces stellatus]